MYDYLIVGSGLYGSICAHELTKKGKKVLVVEKRSHIGGNIYTENIEGINVHKYGAHIFHDELYNLPFNMNTFSKLWGIKTPKEAQEKIENERKKYYKEIPSNLEEQAINLVGLTIYEKLIKGYTAKQWGRPCNELPSFIIKRLPVRFTYDNNYFNDRYQGIPMGGYTQIIEKMLKGIEVRLNTNFLDHKEELMPLAKNIIYTGPIDEFFNYKYGALEYRSVRFEEEILDEVNHQGNAVVNYTEYEVPYTRIIEHKHFEFDVTSKKTVISKE